MRKNEIMQIQWMIQRDQYENQQQSSVGFILNCIDFNCSLLMQFHKIPCAFHDNQDITNFCACAQCLLPLCPLCIKIHTNQHIQMKVDPHYEHINAIIQQIEIDIEGYVCSYNSNYKNIVQLDAKIEQFRNNLRNKIESLKEDIISQVQIYFKNLQQQTDKQIQSMSYIQALNQYKDNAKKSILYMKAIQRGLNDPYKAMRTIIKYKSQRIKSNLGLFQSQIQQFASQVDRNFITFSIREDYKSLLETHLNSIKKIQIKDILGITRPMDLSAKLKEVVHKQNQKKEIKQSIATMLQRNSTPSKICQISRNSSFDGRRRSLSKGKGLTVLMSVNNILNSTLDNAKMTKPLKIVNHDQSFQNMPRNNRINTTAKRRINRA